MTAAMVVGASPENLELQDFKRDMSKLHLTLMSLRSDIDEATGPVRSAAPNEEIRRGVRSALHLVDGVRERLGT